jgi:hypothetical protein
MQVVDLIGGEHGAISVIRQKPPARQDVVVCKIPTAGVCGTEVLPKSRLAPELSCCLQDRADAASGPGRAAVGDSARRWPDAVRGTRKRIATVSGRLLGALSVQEVLLTVERDRW